MSSHWYSAFRQGEKHSSGSGGGGAGGGARGSDGGPHHHHHHRSHHHDYHQSKKGAAWSGSGSRHLLRSSQRSKGSSSSSGEKDSREKFKDCCRQVVQFLFSQMVVVSMFSFYSRLFFTVKVGVGALVVGYTIFGAFAFIAVEGGQEPVGRRMVEHRIAAARQLWNITEVYNVLNFEKWNQEVDTLIAKYQEKVVTAIKTDGFDPRRTSEDEIWNFPMALMFSLSVITMVGYGEFTPTTDWGKITTMVYAVFGIPLYILYLSNMGKILADTFKYLYARLYLCNHRNSSKAMRLRHQYEAHQQHSSVPASPKDQLSLPVITIEDPSGATHPPVIVPSTACVWVMVLYITVATITFAEWEQWNYLDSAYFVATTLMKIGLGDFVPGTGRGAEKSEVKVSLSSEANQTKLVINFLFILIGMGLVAMCYYLMREEVKMKVAELKEEVKWRCRHMDTSSSSGSGSQHKAYPSGYR